jgi:DNA-directed RNA polymerase specialized sigma24 family protein
MSRRLTPEEKRLTDEQSEWMSIHVRVGYRVLRDTASRYRFGEHTEIWQELEFVMLQTVCNCARNYKPELSKPGTLIHHSVCRAFSGYFRGIKKRKKPTIKYVQIRNSDDESIETFQPDHRMTIAEEKEQIENAEEAKKQLLPMVEYLSSTQAKIFTARVLDERNVDIAKVLGVGRHAVAASFKKAVNRLQDIFQGEGEQA